ncbi:Spy/CpxP family protein refolding chaperone [Sphaerotilus sp.]|uniref:Spy/CpxP family protein refolding chaperone n=1 Tax=Sphaerotilus sp. TaxID=2093942 RepID=UPI002ACE1B93|nr:Spy/CpxP family protein refolding chaperone [Sphaerotilus sp.]MDZ7855660.1 Spy/CpxP family protein refolding chaperone [Sphaerotilus sp.]
MRPLIKRSLFALATAGLVLGLSACGHTPFGGEGRGEGRGDRGAHHMGMGHSHSEADMQKRRDKMVERATSELSLDAAQKAKLVTLMDTMHAKRMAMMAANGGQMGQGQGQGQGQGKGQGDMKGHEGHGGRGGMGGGMMPRAEMQALIKGDKFDRAGAQALIDQKANALRTASPDVITAMGDFYDSLNPEQQAKVRAFMERGPMRRGMMGGHRG